MKIASRELLAAAFACALVPQLACQAKPEPADLVVTNGKIVTVDDAKPEAQAVAVRGDRIVDVGSIDAVQRYVATNTQVIDAGGQLVIPGLIESHGHFTGVGESQLAEVARLERSARIGERSVGHQGRAVALQRRPDGRRCRMGVRGRQRGAPRGNAEDCEVDGCAGLELRERGPRTGAGPQGVVRERRHATNVSNDGCRRPRHPSTAVSAIPDAEPRASRGWGGVPVSREALRAARAPAPR